MHVSYAYSCFSFCFMNYLSCPWPCSHYIFCNWNGSHQHVLLWQLLGWTCVSWSLSPSSHAPWHAGGGLDMWHPLSSTSIGPTSWLQNVSLHEKATLSYIPFSQLQFGTGIILPNLLCIALVGQLSLALTVWCHCTSRQCGSSRRLTLLEYLQWPWILPQDSFGLPHPLKWAMCSAIWNLPYLGNLQLWQTMSLLMLDAQRARVTCPFYSSNACCWSSACQSNIGGWNISCPVTIVLQID